MEIAVVSRLVRIEFLAGRVFIGANLKQVKSCQFFLVPQGFFEKIMLMAYPGLAEHPSISAGIT